MDLITFPRPKPPAKPMVRMIDDPAVPQRADRKFTMAGTRMKLVGATDGSYHEHLGGASYGWVTEDGRRGFGKVNRGTSALAAEIAAVKRFLRVNVKYTDVTIYMDSKSAIDAINDARAGLIRSTWTLDVVAELNKVVDASRGMTLKLAWVRGHNNHPLNDAADRLARLARQAKEFKTPRSAADKIADNIVAEALHPVSA